jgi:hypothetical protein
MGIRGRRSFLKEGAKFLRKNVRCIVKGVFQYARPHAPHPQGNLPERAGTESHPAQNAPVGTHNFGAYARKMLIDGYIIKVDYTEQKKLAAAVSRVASNINQICRRINSTGRCYEDDVAELKTRQAEIWELLKIRQKDEL